jgi:hypothetical protein
MPTQQQFCPKCAYIGVIVSKGLAECPLCSWKGEARETLGAITTETFWDEKRVGDLLINVLARHAAGPLVQALEHVGLLPKMIKTENPADALVWNREAQKARDETMRAVMEAAITSAFNEAVKQNKLFAIATDGYQHPMLEPKEREFGGDKK